MTDSLSDAVTAYREAQATLAAATGAVIDAQQRAQSARTHADTARLTLADEIRKAHAGGMTIADLTRRTGYSREGIGKILNRTRAADEDDKEP